MRLYPPRHDGGMDKPLAAEPGTRSRQWLARLSLMLAAAAAVVLVAFSGPKGLVMLAATVAAALVTLAAAYVFLARRGVLRWLALAVFILAPAAVIVLGAFRHLLWVAVVSAGLFALAGITARRALTGGGTSWRPVEYPAQAPPRRPYLIMNTKSGGGKVGQFDLPRKAEALGAEVFLLGGAGHVDIAAVARKAVAGGADLLGVAGGDGTQALVAGIAAEHGIAFVVISAGTRNHFALDLGLDREDPSACLDALRDGVELRVDLGLINGRTFVNNASFGAYAQIVETPPTGRTNSARRSTRCLACSRDSTGPACRCRRAARASTRPRRCWCPTTPTEPATWPAWAAAPGWTAASWAWSPSRWTVPGRRPSCCAAGAPAACGC